jgi:hypothetical protein
MLWGDHRGGDPAPLPQARALGDRRIVASIIVSVVLLLILVAAFRF